MLKSKKIGVTQALIYQWKIVSSRDINITNNISVCNIQFFNFKKNCFDQTIGQIQKKGIMHVLSEKGQSLLIAGRLAAFQENWKKVTQDHWVLHTVQGYQLDLISIPSQRDAPRPTGVQLGTTEGHGIRGTRDAGQGGYRIRPENQEPTTVHINHVPGTQERGPVQTCYKPQSSKSICTTSTFQNGEYSNVKRSVSDQETG